jgi:hypothetical protein
MAVTPDFASHPAIATRSREGSDATPPGGQFLARGGHARVEDWISVTLDPHVGEFSPRAMATWRAQLGRAPQCLLIRCRSVLNRRQRSGFTIFEYSIGAKWLELLREMTNSRI